MKVNVHPNTSFSQVQNVGMKNSDNRFSTLFHGKKEKYVSDGQPDKSSQILSEIKQKGLLRYVQEKREEEIRAKVLSAMNISESELEAMAPEQRNKIEEKIAEAIVAEKLKRMSVSSFSRSNDRSTLPMMLL